MKTVVNKWVKRFCEGRESTTNEERSGRPGTSRKEEIIIQTLRENVGILSGA
jgi:transposase